MKPTQSIIQTKKECFICGCQQEEILSEHHCIENSGRRDNAERLGLKVWLCYYCHQGVHDHNQHELELKQIAQMTFEKKLGTREEWLQLFWKNYL